MLNKSIVMGRLTANPELRHSQAGKAVTSFTLAVDRSYVKAGEERQTDFIDVVAWQRLAEFATKYFAKGRLMIVVGELQSRRWTDKSGNDRKAIEIIASDIEFGEPKRDPMKPEELETVEEDGSDLPF